MTLYGIEKSGVARGTRAPLVHSLASGWAPLSRLPRTSRLAAGTSKPRWASEGYSVYRRSEVEKSRTIRTVLAVRGMERVRWSEVGRWRGKAGVYRVEQIKSSASRTSASAQNRRNGRNPSRPDGRPSTSARNVCVQTWIHQGNSSEYSASIASPSSPNCEPRRWFEISTPRRPPCCADSVRMRLKVSRAGGGSNFAVVQS